ncbi:TetR/AcrR family transcriptional regulator [Rhizobium sp. BK376]|jgi:TetR/AcrR family transcriptional repressor of nem operon|uniref:TetR/AcrR family transcriptional regulator n=1 Tax=Rhizobium sp. BK376 TaxID=2512149 RepID=UPI00104429C2|nr:TetR/AcrR family transcriptional regulator [Rhizobium sp. BK376]TCR89814.1 TetR family transcriptional regulator [Rhizobium sp. BK376]
MRVSREKFAQNREKIIEVAGELFRKKGFDGIGVAEIMKAAGLTHGGFYGHFDSKDELACEASKNLVMRTEERWKAVVEKSPDAPLDALLDHYLSRRNVVDLGDGCVFASLTQEVSRHGPAMQEAFTGGLMALAGILEDLVPGETPEERRRRALASLSSMMGAVILARAMDDPALADEFLSATRQELSLPDSPGSKKDD